MWPATACLTNMKALRAINRNKIILLGAISLNTKFDARSYGLAVFLYLLAYFSRSLNNLILRKDPSLDQDVGKPVKTRLREYGRRSG